ncbi:DUF3576 domain-containing protein [Kiloniella sp. b19]|uniref:DUF3576 domain-containing protein n=1 Tax=Kiloniella sp. GXU_MW_B19 TaxID=3141326 RepID=UPI0031E390B3
MSLKPLFLLSLLTLMVTACTPDRGTPDAWKDDTDERLERTGGSLLGSGEEGNFIFGGPEEKNQGSGAGIGVNAFLWRASLDTLSFMPLNSADPFGGVIITDWYSEPDNPRERFKVNIFILGRDLRSDGVRAAVFRQRLTQAGWVDARVSDETASELEDAILTRAREIRIAGATE